MKKWKAPAAVATKRDFIICAVLFVIVNASINAVISVKAAEWRAEKAEWRQKKS